jgi:hypothetical protein
MTVAWQDTPPSLVEIISTLNRFSASERLLLAKALLDSLVKEEKIPVVAKTNGHGEPVPITDEEWLGSEELVRQIQALPAELDAFHPATKSIEVWLAEQSMNPSPVSSLSFNEWEQLWGEFERDLKTFEHSHTIAEGWGEVHG